VIYPSQCKFLYQLAFPQYLQADTKARGLVKCLSLKMDNHWLYF
jgi:hypothetical protein